MDDYPRRLRECLEEQKRERVPFKQAWRVALAMCPPPTDEWKKAQADRTVAAFWHACYDDLPTHRVRITADMADDHTPAMSPHQRRHQALAKIAA